MIPNPNEVSAFAVYSGLTGMSKSRQRRNRQKRNSGSKLKKDTKLLNGVKKSKKKKESLVSLSKKNRSLKISRVSSKTDLPKTSKLANLNDKPIIESGNIFDNSISNDFEQSIVCPIKIKKTKVDKQVNSTKQQQQIKQKLKKLSLSPTNEFKQIEEVKYSEDNTLVRVPSGDVLEIKSKKQERSNRINQEIELRANKRKLLHQDVKQQMKGRSSTSSVNRGKSVFESLISPYKVENFFTEYWEKKPLYIDREDNNIYSHYLTTAEIDRMLRYNVLMFGRNVDITSYTGGVRETHNPEGRAHPHVIWDYYSNGCSVRILNPQTYLNKIHTLLAALQEYFGCFVGSNIYLTPSNTQGFAPHYDDIEAFVLQVEGSKRWRVYNPRNASEELARFSSGNFSQDEIGSPILDITLKPGDLLYFPRGFIHQAEALPDQHSLHITVSTYQKTSWLDLLEQALPGALTKAGVENVEFRRGLPIGFLRGSGVAYSSTSLKNEMMSKLRKLMSHLEKYVDIDDAVDKLGISFIHQSLPPVLSKDESECSVHNGGLKMNEGELVNRVDITLKTKIRWIRANAIRIVEDKEEASQVRLYHSVDNSKEYEAEDAQFVVLDRELLPAVLLLTKSYPAYTPVFRLPCSSDDKKLVLAGDLWDRGLVISDLPLQASKEPGDS